MVKFFGSDEDDTNKDVEFLQQEGVAGIWVVCPLKCSLTEGLLVGILFWHEGHEFKEAWSGLETLLGELSLFMFFSS